MLSPCRLLLLAFWVNGWAFLANSAATPVEVLLDGVKAELRGNTVNVPRSVKKIVFRLGDSKEMRRVRYLLEGVDRAWVQRAEGMSVHVRFIDKAGDQLLHEIYTVHGISTGWRTTIEDSTFIHRRQTLVVPPATEAVAISFSSAGAPSALGVYVFEDVTVSRLADSDASQELFLESGPFLRAVNPGNAGAQIWRRDGVRPSMAQTILLGGPDSQRRAFCILDDDPSGHAEWVTTKKIDPRWEPGDRIAISWNELYNIGDGNRFDAIYPIPPAGDYVLKVQPVDTIGRPAGDESAIHVSVTLLFWETRWFILGSICLMAVGTFASTHLFVRVRTRRRIERMQQQHMVERERLRIARDIHDDLGARLTNISLISALAAKDELPDYAVANFSKISSMTRELVSALYETIWTVNPENDSLDSLVTFLYQTTHNLCGASGIRCRLDAVKISENRSVTSEVRHDVTLTIKEAIHNAIKHSGATEIQMQIRFEAGALSILVRDNGKGFTLPGGSSSNGEGGNGIGNMHARVRTLGGTMQIESSPGNGTKMWFRFLISGSMSSRCL